MFRRNFLLNGSAAVIGGAFLPLIPEAEATDNNDSSDDDFNSILNRLIHINDTIIPNYLKRQEMDVSNPHFGGILNGSGYYDPQSAGAFIQTGCCSILWVDSSYYRSLELLRNLEKAADYILNVQHPDGTIDLMTTNFHSTPDTGFMVKRLAPIVVILERSDWSALEGLILKLRTFIIRAGEALTVGGIHTPNHRWVVSAALAWVNRLSADPKYVKRIDEWLREGIDIDPDGQFNEKSTSVYSPVTDRVIIMLARLLNRPELLQPVRRNLEMTMYYLHPNGEVATEASGRQDKYRVARMNPYYYPYRYMTLQDDNGAFAAMCHLIEKTAFDGIRPYLNYLIEDESLHNQLPKSGEIPVNYEKAFPYSGIYRIRRDNIDATIIANNATFFTFQNGSAVLQALRFASAFFGKGQFKSREVVKEGDSYVLHSELRGPYFQPLSADQLRTDGDWNKMPRGFRSESEIQQLITTARISEQKGSFNIEIDISGTENVPVAIELGFRKGGELTGVQEVEGIENAYLLSANEGVYKLDGDAITFGKGKAEHRWTQLRGALPKLDLLSVYITGFTPFKHIIEVKW